MLSAANELQSRGIGETILIGTVVANNDPERLERVRIRVPVVLDGVADSDLPWAVPVLPRVQGMGSGIGWCGVPAVGASIYVVFQRGDPHYPIYIGGVVDRSTRNSLFSTNYPYRYGFVDLIGNKFYVDTSTGDVDFEHNSGTKFHIEPSGRVTVVASGDLSLQGTTIHLN